MAECKNCDEDSAPARGGDRAPCDGVRSSFCEASGASDYTNQGETSSGSCVVIGNARNFLKFR